MTNLDESHNNASFETFNESLNSSSCYQSSLSNDISITTISPAGPIHFYNNGFNGINQAATFVESPGQPSQNQSFYHDPGMNNAFLNNLCFFQAQQDQMVKQLFLDEAQMIEATRLMQQQSVVSPYSTLVFPAENVFESPPPLLSSPNDMAAAAAAAAADAADEAQKRKKVSLAEYRQRKTETTKTNTENSFEDTNLLETPSNSLDVSFDVIPTDKSVETSVIESGKSKVNKLLTELMASNDSHKLNASLKTNSFELKPAFINKTAHTIHKEIDLNTSQNSTPINSGLLLLQECQQLKPETSDKTVNQALVEVASPIKGDSRQLVPTRDNSPNETAKTQQDSQIKIPIKKECKRGEDMKSPKEHRTGQKQSVTNLSSSSSSSFASNNSSQECAGRAHTSRSRSKHKSSHSRQRSSEYQEEHKHAHHARHRPAKSSYDSHSRRRSPLIDEFSSHVRRSRSRTDLADLLMRDNEYNRRHYSPERIEHRLDGSKHAGRSYVSQVEHGRHRSDQRGDNYDERLLSTRSYHSRSPYRNMPDFSNYPAGHRASGSGGHRSGEAKFDLRHHLNKNYYLHYRESSVDRGDRRPLPKSTNMSKKVLSSSSSSSASSSACSSPSPSSMSGLSSREASPTVNHKASRHAAEKNRKKHVKKKSKSHRKSADASTHT